MPRNRPDKGKPTIQLTELVDRLAGQPPTSIPRKPTRRKQEADQRGAAFRLNEALCDHSRG